ncbi:MAG: CHAT domain-containing tetratricopeptide repeat protein [Cytophagales bacterium]|nr:CHAT domain-containing tetratricopeptide repeat protein [Cytophagales bacterium]
MYRIILFIVLSSAMAYAQNVDVKKTIFTADSLFVQGEYDKALLLYAPMKDTKYRLRYAECHAKTGRLDEATDIISNIYNSDLSTINNTYALNIYSFIQLSRGKIDKAIELYNKALIMAANNKDDQIECLKNLGVAYWQAGNNSLATEHLTKALNLATELSGEKSARVAAIYNNMGLVHTGENDDKALEYYQKALQTYQNFYKEWHPSLAIAYTNIGIIYQNKKDYIKALDNFDRALIIWKNLYGEWHPNFAFTIINIGKVLMERGSYAKAEQNFMQAYDILTKNFGKKNPEISVVYNLLGTIKEKNNDLKSAIVYYHKALIANAPDFDNLSITQNPPTANYYNANLLLTTYTLKAKALENYYIFKTLKKKHLMASMDLYLRCDTLIDNIRRSRVNKSDKISLGVVSNEVYDQAINTCLMLADVNINKKKYHELAFYFNEKSKSAVLLESISESNAKSFAGIPDTVLDMEAKLKADISYHEQKIAQKSDEKTDKKLRDKLFELNRTYEKFTKNMEQSYPEYYNLKFNVYIARVKDLQKSIPDNTMLISYFASEQKSRMYIFKVTSKRFMVQNVPLSANYQKNITAMRNVIKFKVAESFNQVSYELYRQLFPGNLQKSYTNLAIIPDGKMGTVPFEALLSQKYNKDTYTDAPFLIKSKNISYNYSNTLYIQNIIKNSEDTSYAKTTLLCAPVTFTAKTNGALLDNLPGSENEINEIKNLFSTYKWNVKTLMKEDAKESNIKSKELKNYAILHLATHGIVNESHPDLSQVFLNPDAANKEDGNLYSGEIYNLQLGANLVALSACETGLGKVTKGEGIIGLTRALIYAGADNILVSLWSVSDASTSQLMIDFYDNILKNKNIGYAGGLRNAKLKLIQNPTYSQPYYWAPFVLVGQ